MVIETNASLTHYASRYYALITPVIGASNSNPTPDIASKIELLIGTYISRKEICEIGGCNDYTIDNRLRGHQITKQRVDGKIKYLLTDKTAAILFNKNGKNGNKKNIDANDFRYWKDKLLSYCDKKGIIIKELGEEKYTEEYYLLHFPKVYLVSHKCANKFVFDDRISSINDFVSVGMEALLDVRKQFANRNGYSLQQWSDYLDKLIENRIIDHLRETSYKSRSLIRREKDIAEAEKQFNEKGEDATDSKIIKKLGISVNSLRMSRLKSAYAQPHASLDDPAFLRDNNESRWGDTTAPSPLDITIETEQESHLWKLVDTLNPRHRGVLRFYYKHGLTLDQISNFIGIGSTPVDESRVCQIRKDALSKLKEKLKTDEAYLDY